MQFAFAKFLKDANAVTKEKADEGFKLSFDYSKLHFSAELYDLGVFFAREILARGIREFDCIVGYGKYGQLLAHSVVLAYHHLYRYRRTLVYVDKNDQINNTLPGFNPKNLKKSRSAILVAHQHDVEEGTFVINKLRELTSGNKYAHNVLADHGGEISKQFVIVGAVVGYAFLETYPDDHKYALFTKETGVSILPITIHDDYEKIFSGPVVLPAFKTKAAS